MTQHEAILKYIDDYGSITPMQAFSDLGVTKLATRVSEMKKKGYKFEITEIEATTRYGKKVRYCKYRKAGAND
jgi:hypothetical protein